MEILLKYAETALDQIVRYAPRILIAMLMAWFGWKLIQLAGRGLNKTLANRRIDPSLRPFMTSLLDALLKVALVVTLIGYLGIPTASFVAVIGAAGLAIGMALSGTLQNFAGGVILLVLRPIRVGDFVEVMGYLGKVDEIRIFNTTLLTPDNKTVFIPNGKLANDAITNFSLQPTRRIDLHFGIGYNDDIDQARALLENIISADSRIMKTPEPLIVVDELADSSVNLLLRVWTASGDFFPVSCDLRETVKKTFDKEGISIPFPQCDLHLIPASSAS